MGKFRNIILYLLLDSLKNNDEWMSLVWYIWRINNNYPELRPVDLKSCKPIQGNQTEG